jgi:ATP-binding cassette subfamily F protein uup
MEFTGTLLLVSHDRAFLDNVVTSTIAFEEDGPHQYVGGYEDWIRQKQARKPASGGKPKKQAGDNKKNEPSGNKKRGGLTYAQELELQELPGQIEELENRINALHEEMADPAFFQQEQATIRAKQDELKNLEGELEETFERWAELDALTSENA